MSPLARGFAGMQRPKPRHSWVCDSVKWVGHDRVLLAQADDGLRVAVLDGAGGYAGVKRTMEVGVALVEQRLERVVDADDCVDLLLCLDEEIYQRGRGGEVVAVVAKIDRHRVVGSSCGDCRLTVFPSGLELTRLQRSKPRLGSGVAAPVAFSYELAPDEWVLAASDGLYDVLGDCPATALSPASAPGILLRHTRDAGGTDDVAIVTAW